MLLKQLSTSWLLPMAVLTMLLAVPNPVEAQDAPTLTEKQKSVILFDLRVAKTLAEAESIGMDVKSLDDTPMQGGMFDGIKVNQVKRIFGSASLPENMGSAMALAQGGTGDLPFEFFLRIEFTDAGAVEQLEKQCAEMSETVEIGGKTYYRPDGAGPQNLVAHRFDETSFELGTTAYCQQPTRRFFTDGLLAAYKTAPNEPYRIVIDLASREDFIAEAVQMGKQMADPTTGAFLDLVDNANSIVLTSSLTSKNLMTLQFAGKDSENAEELASGLDSLLGLAKVGATMAFGQMQNQMPKEAAGSLAAIKKVVDSLETKTDGTTILIEVPKPEGFEEALVQMQKTVQTESAKVRRMNNYRQLALGAINFESAYQKFPFLYSNNMHEDISWRVKILPFVEQNAMYDQMDLTKSPTDSQNAAFAEKMPTLFGNDGKMATACWIKSTVERFADITDGSSNTIMLLETPEGRPWLENKPLSVDEAVEVVTGLEDGADVVAVRYDGSVLMLSNQNQADELRAMFSPKDGQ